MSDVMEIPVDPMVLPMLGRDSVCEECRREGVRSHLTWMNAGLEKASESEVVEVHAYGCSRGHWWNRRTAPRPMAELGVEQRGARPVQRETGEGAAR